MAMEKETEKATSLPSALSASVADIRLVTECGDRTQCAYSAAFINRQRHYERHVKLAFGTMTVIMTLRGLFVTQGSFKKRRLHRRGHGHLVYGVTLGELVTSFSIFGIAPRRIQLECFRSIREMRAKLSASAPLRDSCQAFRLVIGQRDALQENSENATCKRGVGVCAACFLWIILLRKHAPSMLTTQTIAMICKEFYESTRAASESSIGERSEWREAIAIEEQGLYRVFNDVCSDIVDKNVNEWIDKYQYNVWGVVGLDRIDRVDCAFHDRDTASVEETDSLESFEGTI